MSGASQEQHQPNPNPMIPMPQVCLEKYIICMVSNLLAHLPSESRAPRGIAAPRCKPCSCRVIAQEQVVAVTGRTATRRALLKCKLDSCCESDGHRRYPSGPESPTFAAPQSRSHARKRNKLEPTETLTS